METGTIIALVSVVIALVSAGASFYFSLLSKKHATESLKYSKAQHELSKRQEIHKYITEACEAFGKEGTPLYYINSLTVLSADQKEDLWNQTYMRHKKRKPKRSFSEEARLNIK